MVTCHREIGVLLPDDYKPSPHTVIVGRGKEPKQNLGNKRLQVLASSFLKRYQQGDKKVKTQTVSDIISMIREACNGGKGAFVKHDKNGQWYEQDNSVAREKIGYVFRDLLADDYKSSTKSKMGRRPTPPSKSPSETTESSATSDLGSCTRREANPEPSTEVSADKRRSSFNFSEILIRSKTSLDDFLLNLSETVEGNQQGILPLDLSDDEEGQRLDREFMSSLPLLLAEE